MNYKIIYFSLFFLVPGLLGNNVENSERENDTVIAENSRQGRAVGNAIYAGLIGCAYQYDAGCFVDVAQNYLDLKKRELLEQADQEVARSSEKGVTPSNKPSQLASTIEKLFSDLAGLFKDGFSSFFGKDDDDDELTKETKEDDDDDDEDDKKDESRDVGEARKKKKKKKKKFLAIFLAVVTALGLLIKLVQAGLLLKLAVTTVAILGVSVAKFLYLLKHGKQKTIYYENSHHDHHYEHDDIYEHDDQHGWGRSIANSSQTRKKKKEHKLVRLVHKILLYVVVVTVLIFILKFTYAFIAKKYLLLSIGYFIWNSIKYFIWIKNNKHQIIYAPHDDDSHSAGDHSHGGYDYEDHVVGHSSHEPFNPEPYWGKEDHAHYLAYSNQKPQGSGLSSFFG